MKPFIVGLPLVAALLGAAQAQTAAELVTVTTISSTLDSGMSIRFPMTTSFVNNPKYAQALAPTLLGAETGKFGDYRLYVGKGLIKQLAVSYAAELRTTYAVNGYFETGSRNVIVKGETWSRVDFTNDTGRRAVLLMSARQDGVYVLSAVGR